MSALTDDVQVAAPEPEKRPETDVGLVSERDDASDDIDGGPLQEASLDGLANMARTAIASVNRHDQMANEGRLTVGRVLLEARRRFPSNNQFGQWFDAQQFGVSRQWGLVLRNAAEKEVEIRGLLTSSLSTGH